MTSSGVSGGQTTVADIARRAGLTERTFFRYFADNREVLFWSAGALEEPVVKAVAGAPASTSPIDNVALALEAAGAPSASLTTEAGIAVFRIAFERWVDDAQKRDLPRLIRESLEDLNSVVAGSPSNGHTTLQRHLRA